MEELLAKPSMPAAPQSLQEIFAQELYEKRLRLQEICSTQKFQEAIFHQSQDDCPDSIYAAIVNFSRQNIDRNMRNQASRRKELLAYNYLQRFCTKNETTSFFGPSFIGKFAESEKNMGLSRANGDRIKNRKVYAAMPWLEKILDGIINDDEIFKTLKPRLAPTVYLDKRKLVDGLKSKEYKLGRVDYQILCLLVGDNTVGKVSSELKKIGIDQKLIVERLRAFIKEGLLLSGLEINRKTPEADEYLLSKLSIIPTEAKDEWCARLKRLVELKNKFEKDDLPRRLNTILELRKIFSTLLVDLETNIGKERRFFTEYCELNLELLDLGESIYHHLQSDIGLILDLACFNENKLNKLKSSLLYGWLKDNLKDGEISLKDTILNIIEKKGKKYSPFAFGNMDLSFAAVENIPQAFLDLINKNKEANLARFNREEVKISLTEYLDTSNQPAATGCDILICAANEEAINKGDYKIVFGEIHPMHTPLSIYKFFAETSLGGLNIVDEIKKIHRTIGKKYTLGDLLVNLDDICIDFPAILEVEYETRSGRIKNKASICDLKLKRKDNSVSLIVSGKKKPVLLLAPLPYFGTMFSMISPVLSGLRSSVTKEHFPRVEIDNFVFQREQWVFLKSDLFFIRNDYEKKGVDLWLDLERWRRKKRIPRQFFLKIDAPEKPIFIDFEDYFAVETFMKFTKRAKEKMSIIEMLPGPEDLWFKDREGRYTSEFRLIAYKN